MLPSPILSGLCVINRIRPTVSYLLSWIRLISDLQLRFLFPDFISKLFGRKADSCQVVCHSVLDLFWWCVHDVNRPLNRIVDIHHRQTGLLLDEACIFAFQNAVVEDCNCIISGPSSRFSLPTDNARVSDTSDVQTILIEVVCSQHLTGVFCHSIHRGWLDWAMLGSALLWGCRPEYSHWTCAKYFVDLQLNCNVKNVFVRN